MTPTGTANSLNTTRKCGRHKEIEGVWEQEMFGSKREKVTGWPERT